MGVINQGILGGFSGKVGPVVGAKWKEIDYMRGYVVPANPNTTGQQAVRAKFAQLVAYARGLLATILQTFWDPFYTNMSGFNAWISQNYALAGSDGVIDETAVISKGTLEISSMSAATYDTADGSVNTTNSAAISGNGDDGDFGALVVIDVSDGFVFCDGEQGTRSDGGLSVNIGAGRTATNLYCFTFFWRGTGSELVVSDSQGLQMSAV